MTNHELKVQFSNACDYLFDKTAYNVPVTVKEHAGRLYNESLFALTKAGLNHIDCYLKPSER